MNGLTISRRYFTEIAEPRLKNDLPDYYHMIAAGLVGNGSECFGYDDALSRDHDWGADFFVWLPDTQREAVPIVQKWKDELFEKHPPENARSLSAYGAQIAVMTGGEFYASLIGYPNGPDTITDWRRIPEDNLAMATNGAVFIDNAGQFTATRDKLLRYFPEDLRRKKLAAKCMAMAQTGQYNFKRCYQRQDWVTLKTVLSRFNDAAIAAVFLLNRMYKPYYKWAYRKMTELPLLGGVIAPILKDIAITCGTGDDMLSRIQTDIDRICALIADELRRQTLSVSDDWFLATQGEEIQHSIQDEFLRALPAQYE